MCAKKQRSTCRYPYRHRGTLTANANAHAHAHVHPHPNPAQTPQSQQMYMMLRPVALTQYDMSYYQLIYSIPMPLKFVQVLVL